MNIVATSLNKLKITTTTKNKTMEKEDFIQARMFAFQHAMQFRFYSIDGEDFLDDEFNVYEKSEEILSYILDGKIPVDELKDLLN